AHAKARCPTRAFEPRQELRRRKRRRPRRAGSTRGPGRNRVRTRRCCVRYYRGSARRSSAPQQTRGAGRTPLRSAKPGVESAGFVRQLREALLIGGATLEAGAALGVGALGVGAGVGALSGPA